MFVHYRSKGLILKKVDRAEADQLLLIYTKDFGRLEILAKAVRKISSKLRAGAEIFYLSEVEFIQGKAQKTLTDAILIEKFENLRKDLKKLKVACKIAEVSDNLISDQEPDEKIWQLFLETFDKLNAKYPEGKPPTSHGAGKIQDTIYKIYYYFLWNLLLILGYKPELYNCVVCQRKIAPENIFFSPREGGVICNLCKKSVKSTKEIKPETIKILRLLLKRDWATLKRLKIEGKDLDKVKTISDYFISEIITVSKKSRK